MKNKLEKILNESGFDRSKAIGIWNNFTVHLDAALTCAAKADGLEITNVSQVDDMKLARSVRISLRDIRVAAEKTKKKLKADIVKEGKFIDTTYNLIVDTTKPIEADLLEKEQFAKRIEVKNLVLKRESRLEPFANTADYQLAEMTDEQFENLLFHRKAMTEERARMEAANARLMADAAERERQLSEERAKVEIERQAKDEANRRERESRQAAERIVKKKQKEELRKAREASNRLQRKLEAEKADKDQLQRKLEAEKADKDRLHRKEADIVETQRKERLRLESASEKVKLATYLSAITKINAPKVNSAKARKILDFVNASIRMCIKKTEEL